MLRREREDAAALHGDDELLVEPGQQITVENIQKGLQLARWDPHITPIVAEMDGRVRFDDLIEGHTLRTEKDLTLVVGLPILATVPLMMTSTERRKRVRRRVVGWSATAFATAATVAVVTWKYSATITAWLR